MKKITTLAMGLLLASAAFAQKGNTQIPSLPVSYTHLRAHETN